MITFRFCLDINTQACSVCAFVIGITFCTVQKHKHGSRSVDCWWMICNLDYESLNTVFMWILGFLCQIKLDFAANTWTQLLPCTSASMQASATGYFLWISILLCRNQFFYTPHTHIYSSHELCIFPTKIVVECKPQEFGKKPSFRKYSTLFVPFSHVRKQSSAIIFYCNQKYCFFNRWCKKFFSNRK